jgi:glycosyltransferase involved in cell wall biosynthesis
MSASLINMSESARFMWLLKRGISFLRNLEGIVFFAEYPYAERQSDGYFQRVQLVDGLFSDQWRIYIESERLPESKHWIDRPKPNVLVFRICGGPGRRWLLKALALLAVLRCQKIYIHSLFCMQGKWFRILMRAPGITKVFDMHGVVPEELRIQNDLRNALVFEAHERLAVLKSDLVIVVSEAMKNYLHKKYRHRLRASIVIFPIFLNVGPVDPARSYHDGKPAVIYAGGLQKWQQVDKMIDAISRTVSMCAHRFYCPDPDSVRKMLPQAIRSQIIIDRKTHAELNEIYSECHYGFILREDIIVNHVACPTKLIEYLATGVVPIVDSDNIGDFKTMGMRFITLQQLLQGNLPNEMERIKMARNNFVVYEHLRNIRNQGEQEICAMLAGTQENGTFGSRLMA